MKNDSSHSDGMLIFRLFLQASKQAMAVAWSQQCKVWFVGGLQRAVPVAVPLAVVREGPDKGPGTERLQGMGHARGHKDKGNQHEHLRGRREGVMSVSHCTKGALMGGALASHQDSNLT